MTLLDDLASLEAAVEAVRRIGLADHAERAEAVLQRARERTGFPGSAYVLALAGGTGVGKSSLLNALAGTPVSEVRAVRPTTEAPIAWIAEDHGHELRPLLDWLSVERVAAHHDASLADVVILDLPDVDSIRTDHRATVDALLPRIDSAWWVVDPEKYDDERLHEYLRSLSQHADRMSFVLNKRDRLSDEETATVVEDLRRRLAESGMGQARVEAVSAATGTGIAELRARLAAQADAKAIVTAKVVTDVRTGVADLASALGIDPSGYEPLLSAERRQQAVDDAVRGAVQVIDPAGLSRQVQAAILNRARRSGGSLLGRAVALLGWLTGQRRRRADPGGYLRDWRRRGSLGRVLNPVHAALVEAASGVPPSTRAAILSGMGAERPDEAVSRALDDVARDTAADLEIPSSPIWPVLGAVQLAVGAVFVFAVAWYVTLFVAGGHLPVATAELPVLGPLPLPLVLLIGSLVLSALLGLLLSLHARWIAAGVAARLTTGVRTAVEREIERAVMAPVDEVESVRKLVAETTGA
ncbi:MAG: 50S ribosome-binding GTPase [Chloroflexota bacterium]|nr:50S ribosome-binding GTPase [Chloroflexota bacterium]